MLTFLKCHNCGKTLIEENDTPQKQVRSPIVPALDRIFYGSQSSDGKTFKLPSLCCVSYIVTKSPDFKGPLNAAH